jgi:hypothetical protein
MYESNEKIYLKVSIWETKAAAELSFLWRLLTIGSQSLGVES